jgi:site-specific DNA-methyltransferase (adenine-specific)
VPTPPDPDRDAPTRPSPDDEGGRAARRGTSTSNFGVSKRENHDSSDFYARFAAPEVDTTERPAGPEADRALDRIVHGDSRDMSAVADGTVALVVTSPPYFAGKEYEEALGEGGVPGSYLDYLDMLTDVFAECVRTLEPGGRIAVNVANLGRRPYRSLGSDVVAILQDRLRLLLRGEIVWQKQRGAGGNCAWGSFQRPGNPVLRDLTERVVVASKGRFDRALTAKQRHKAGLPSVASLTRDEFMDATLDVWDLPAESANRVGHPAPFPVALPERLIHLYTYRDDLVLDPFMGSGSTAVAAVRTGRHFVGYDTDAGYIERAMARVDEERAAREHAGIVPSVVPAGTDDPADAEEDPVRRAMVEGLSVRDVARTVLTEAGFAAVHDDVALPGGLDLSFMVTDRLKKHLYVEVCGGFSATRPGLRRVDALWRALGKAAVLAAVQPGAQLVLLTTDLPQAGTPAAQSLAAVTGRGKGRTVLDVVDLRSAEDRERLKVLASGRRPPVVKN